MCSARSSMSLIGARVPPPRGLLARHALRARRVRDDRRARLPRLPAAHGAASRRRRPQRRGRSASASCLGICIGIVFLRRGFDLKRSYPARTLEGTTLPAVMTGLLLLVLPRSVPCSISVRRAPARSTRRSSSALVIAIVVGALAQKSRLCMVGGIRDTIMLRDCAPAVGLHRDLRRRARREPHPRQFQAAASTSSPSPTAAHLWNLLGMAARRLGLVFCSAAARCASSSSPARATATAPSPCSA